METLHVVAAIILDHDKILIAKRKSGDLKGLWEFPGGKVKSNESKEKALQREILEEFEIPIVIDSFLLTVHYDYPSFQLSMDCFICHSHEEITILNSHSEIKWVTIDENLRNINWVPADIQIIDKLITRV